jgi:hypothetical protein
MCYKKPVREKVWIPGSGIDKAFTKPVSGT